MNKIRQLREAKKLTQADLAKKLNTTQQTIQRWEAGKTNISSDSLKELAIILDCSVDELLGIAEYSRTRYSTWFLSESEKKGRQKLIGNYGGVYLKMQKILQIKDYPIDDIAAQAIDGYFPEIDRGSLDFNWIYFETMDNKIVFVNLRALKSVKIYTEHCEAAPPFSHPEVYRFITNWDADYLADGTTAIQIAQDNNISEDFAEKVIGVINNYEKIEQEEWCRISFDLVRVYWTDGEKESFMLDKRLWWTISDLKTLCNDPTFYSENNESYSGMIFLEKHDWLDYREFLNLNNIALIEVPATKYWQLTCEDDPTLLEERNLSPYLPFNNNNSTEK
jgi:transcriptional regulator with XRE-family HTH domain